MFISPLEFFFIMYTQEERFLNFIYSSLRGS